LLGLRAHAPGVGGLGFLGHLGFATVTCYIARYSTPHMDKVEGRFTLQGGLSQGGLTSSLPLYKEGTPGGGKTQNSRGETSPPLHPLRHTSLSLVFSLACGSSKSCTRGRKLHRCTPSCCGDSGSDPKDLLPQLLLDRRSGSHR